MTALELAVEQRERAVAVAGLVDVDRPEAILEDRADAAANHRVIVDEQHPVHPASIYSRAMGDRSADELEALSHTGSWRWEVATGDVRWSDELFRIYGLAPQARAITFEFFTSCVLPEDRARVRGHIESAIAARARFSYRERIVRPSGDVRTLDTAGDVVVDAAGTVTHLVGACRDVTDDAHRDARLRFDADVFANLAIGLAVWQRDRRDGDSRARLVAFNHACELLAGRTLAARIGEAMVAVFPELDGGELLAAARSPALDAPRRFAALRLADAPGAPLLAPMLFPLPNDHVGLALEDVTRAHADELVQAGERRALEMLAGGAPQPAILELLVRTLEDASDGALGSILLLDASGRHVVHGAAPRLPADYVRAIDGRDIGPAAGSCGTAAYRGEPVYVADIARDPLWADYRELALGFDLRACWSSPILSSAKRVLGTFALYFREPREADARARELLERASHVAGIVLERRALDEQLRALASKIEAAREHERTAIARDVHDQLGQALTALKLDVGWLARRVTDPALDARLVDMARALDDTLRAVRRISAELRPGILDDLGLEAAIEWQIEEFQVRTGICSVAHTTIGAVQLDGELATTVFRILQESLTNVARHAHAGEVQVSLSLEHGHVRLVVEDDGIGIPEVGRPADSLGLLGMRERAAGLGGRFAIARREPRGTIVTVDIPLRFPSEQRAGM